MARTIPSPLVSVENEAFWNAAKQGRFTVPTCSACGKAHWYPRAICPFCASDKIEWRAASGKGTIYTYSVMRRAKEPYAIAYVTLAEGPTMMTNHRRLRFRRAARRPAGYRRVQGHRKRPAGADVQAGIIG